MPTILIEWRGVERWVTKSERDLFARVIGLGPLVIYISNERVSQRLTEWKRLLGKIGGTLKS